MCVRLSDSVFRLHRQQTTGTHRLAWYYAPTRGV